MFDASTFKKETRLIEIMNSYSAENGYGSILVKIADSLENPEMIVPVLGMQGMGKSTLINALLGENILPNDADETTCVPVEVRYGSENKAYVHFFNSDKTQVAMTREDLNKYVDNNSNPGNEKGVSHIVLYRQLPILESGLVIVDLPGVGSLTKNNQETTMRYIEKLCTAIFVIPTIPTIRRVEEIFIKGVWKSFSSAVFVQNSFSESKREIAESVNFNTKVLKNIASEINVPFENGIMVINAYDAAYGTIHSDDELVKKSNLPALVEMLNFTARNRSSFELQRFRERVELALKSVKRIIMELMDQARLSRDELREALEKNELEFRSHTKEIEEQVVGIIDFLAEKGEEVSELAKKLSRESVENLRSSMHQLIDRGVVDGQQLTEAFMDYQTQYASEAANVSFDKMSEISYDLGTKLEALEQVINVERSNSVEAAIFNNGQAFKFEKGLQVGVNLGGAVGGILAYAPVAGLVAGALKGGALGSAAGPIGVVAGVVAGIGVSLIANFIGSKSRQAITSQRGTKTKEQIRPYISEFGKSIEKSFLDSFETMNRQVNDILEKYIENRKSYYKKMKEDHEQRLREDYEPAHNPDELSRDLDYIKAWEEKFLG